MKLKITTPNITERQKVHLGFFFGQHAFWAPSTTLESSQEPQEDGTVIYTSVFSFDEVYVDMDDLKRDLGLTMHTLDAATVEWIND